MTSRAISHFENHLISIPTVAVAIFGSSLIVAPHPDDETLGCGGTAALLIQKGFRVDFVFISDGTMSHPNSKKYPTSRLRMIREREALEAVGILGGKTSNTVFFALPDRNVPTTQSPFFEAAVRLMVDKIVKVRPETIFMPWQKDPHPDHRATWQIVTEAVLRLELKPRMLEYPIWFWEMADDSDLQTISKMEQLCVDIGSVLDVKRRALSAHQSQVSGLIDDDPQGFRLSEETIAHFDHDREVFFELKQDISK